MQDFVSTGWIRMAGFIASLSLVWAVFSPYRFPWMGLTWVTLACLGAFWLRMRSPRSIGQVIDDIEAEPVRALVAAGPVAVKGPKAAS